MNSQITIEPVRSKKDLKTFIKIPWKIYLDDPNWVPPLIMDMKTMLDKEKNPFWKHSEGEYFIARKEGQPVGRIAAIINHNHNSFHDELTGFFGFFESVNDEAVAHALLDAAEKWTKERGMKIFRGPMNPSTNDSCGFLLEGFNSPPVIMMTYNPRYYLDFMESYGLKKAKDLFAYFMDGETVPISDKVKHIAELIQKRNKITIRSANMKRFQDELRIVKMVYNDAWSKNWGFVPFTDEEIDHIAEELKPIVVADLAIVAEIDGEPAGFSLAIPDYNQALIHVKDGRLFPTGLIKLLWYKRKIDTLRVIIMGMRHKYRNLGVDAVFYYETYKRGMAHGYTKGEFSWILEDNAPMNHTLEKLGSWVYKKYRIYEKSMEN
ncbi:MAG: N-acetyltransferase [Calditrichaeota bacterium]|nr:N-acetyltransferase [Calditrichota bacterium]